MTSDYDFAKSLIDIPLAERYNYISQSIKQFKESANNPRQAVSERLDSILKILKGGE